MTELPETESSLAVHFFKLPANCRTATQSVVQAAEWNDVMAAEPMAAVDDRVPAGTGAAAAAAGAGSFDADIFDARLTAVNPFGTPTADLMATLSGKAPSSLSSYGSKSSAGEDNS